MASRARLLPVSDADVEPCFPIKEPWMTILAFTLIVPVFCLMPYMVFTTLQTVGRIKFSMEPVVYTGLDLTAEPAAPPSFNVTLRARSTYGLTKVCTSGRAAMEVSYSGTTIAMADVEPFCLDPRKEKVITATTSPGWPVLPVVLQESMESDRRDGGIQLEVGFGFEDEQDARWVRCRTTLGDDKASPCNVFYIRGCCRSS